MAFNLGNNQQSNNSGQQDARWKKDGFVNFYLPKRNGDGTIGKFKLGAAGLAKSNPSEAKLLELATQDQAAFLEMVKKHLIIEFNPTTGAPADFAFE